MNSREDKMFSFRRIHPLSNFIYFIAVIIITMFTLNPYIVAISFLFSLLYMIYLKGIKGVSFEIRFGILIILITAFFNPLISHYGNTILLYINSNRITLEAFIRGLVVGFIIATIINWFAIMQAMFDSERFMSIFARSLPKLSLLVSMILRFIPELQRRFEQIHEANRPFQNNSKLGQSAKEYSILVTWSLEENIDVADSMESKGYGLAGRKSIKTFKWNVISCVFLFISIACFGISIYSLFDSKFKCLYFPYFIVPKPIGNNVIYLMTFLCLMLLPFIVKIIGDFKWKLSMSKI